MKQNANSGMFIVIKMLTGKASNIHKNCVTVTVDTSTAISVESIYIAKL